MSDKQPEALRLAESYDDALTYEYSGTDDWITASANELSRLHALLAELVEALNLALDYLEHSTEFRIGHPGFERAQAIAKAALSKAKES
jgi:hypothetical protein